MKRRTFTFAGAALVAAAAAGPLPAWAESKGE